jgi:hypothetical protein
MFAGSAGAVAAPLSRGADLGRTATERRSEERRQSAVTTADSDYEMA